jgi:hypothetical protein
MTGAVEHRLDLYPGRRVCDLLVEVGHHGGTAVELHQPQAPRQALAEEEVVAVVEDRLCNELPSGRLFRPPEIYGKAALTSFARGVLDHAACAALLQLEAPERRGGGEAERDAAARRRRQRRQAGAEDGIFSFQDCHQGF